MHLLRTIIKKEIICEFLHPSGKTKKDKVIIFCDGMPTLPNKKTLLEFWSRKGYWTFHLRYRGTWESYGEFLIKSPHEDVLDVVEHLSKHNKIKSFWDDKEFQINPYKIYVFGSSFGGTSALLSSLHPMVDKVIAFCPVVNWSIPSKTEPMEWFGGFVKKSFGNAYRFSMKNWKKLGRGDFYNPISYVNKMDGKKIFIMHAQDDKIVNYKSVQKFAKKTNSTFTLYKKGGHVSLSLIMTPRIYKKIKKFLSEK